MLDVAATVGALVERPSETILLAENLRARFATTCPQQSHGVTTVSQTCGVNSTQAPTAQPSYP